MRWARKMRSADKGRNDYAMQSDFCAVFLQQLDRLYSLALILIGDELIAEKCFLAAFDSCVEQAHVFRESALSWSRRTVIKTAISFMSPTPFCTNRRSLSSNRNDLNVHLDVPAECLLELPAFDRFAYVMSVLEGYADRDCALLLGCSCPDVVAARIRAFQQISRSAIERYPDYGSDAPRCAVNADWLECG